MVETGRLLLTNMERMTEIENHHLAKDHNNDCFT